MRFRDRSRHQLDDTNLQAAVCRWLGGCVLTLLDCLHDREVTGPFGQAGEGVDVGCCDQRATGFQSQ